MSWLNKTEIAACGFAPTILAFGVKYGICNGWVYYE